MMITSPTSYMAEIDAPKIKLFGATIPVEASAEKTATAATTTTTTTTTTTKPSKALPCPRCKSTETKFCYFNNYNVNQPRHFCKGCQRYWTAGGTLRNVPFGAGRRKAKIPGQAAAAAAMAGFAGECVLGQSEVRELGLEGVVEEWSARVSASRPAKRRSGNAVAYAQIR